MIDYQQQRTNMVESQVRTSDVTDRRILKAMLEVPRELFAPQQVRALAYMEDALQVGLSRYLLPPRTLARLIQLGEIDEGMRVIDVGCATGYSTAVLAKIGAEVVAVESDTALARSAADALSTLGLTNAMVVRGPLAAGAADKAPFQVILLNGAVAKIPESLLEQLDDGGRLVAVISEGSFGCAKIWRRSGGSFDARPAFDAAAMPLPGFAVEAGFVF
jgi:protein-L-isoaspartate(D-aspartate) O-methyltransferase